MFTLTGQAQVLPFGQGKVSITVATPPAPEVRPEHQRATPVINPGSSGLAPGLALPVEV